MAFIALANAYVIGGNPRYPGALVHTWVPLVPINGQWRKLLLTPPQNAQAKTPNSMLVWCCRARDARLSMGGRRMLSANGEYLTRNGAAGESRGHMTTWTDHPNATALVPHVAQIGVGN
jgi:hypothetical protein